MSGHGEPTLELADAGSLRLAIVSSQWHEVVCGALLDGAIRAGRRAADEAAEAVSTR